MTLQKHDFGSGGVVAYGFRLEEADRQEEAQNHFLQLFYSADDVRSAMSYLLPDVQVLICDQAQGAIDCEGSKEALAENQGQGRVSPLNLAAALHKDNPARDIYLQNTHPNALYISRVEATGARGVVSALEAQELLNLLPSSLNRGERSDQPDGDAPEEHSSLWWESEDVWWEESTCVEQAPRCADSPSEVQQDTANERLRVNAPLDMAWLEEVLALDEIDELPIISGTLTAERAVRTGATTLTDPPVEPQRRLSSDAEDDEGAIVAAFISGRGGVGKSSLSVLTAVDLWLAGSKVALLDMDLQFGDISVLAGHEPEAKIKRLTIEQVCSEQVRLARFEDSLLLIEAPTNPVLAEELVHQIPQLLSLLRKQVDTVLINTSCLWNETAAVLARHADKLIVCMDQRATSISAARQVIDLCYRLQIPSTQMLYLLNRCKRNSPITDIDASLAMGGVDIISVAEGGADVDELLSLGCPLELLSAQVPLRQSIQALERALQDNSCHQTLVGN